MFQAGVDRGVLYIPDRPGVAWNGLTSVTEDSVGGEIRSYYIDGVKYAQYSSVEEFEGTIEAYMYPPEFERCDGYGMIYSGLYARGQRRSSFGLSYRVKIGNDTQGPEHAYKIHLIYNAIAEPSASQNDTLDDSVTPTTFSWKIKTLPPSAITGYRRTAHFVIDSRRANVEALLAVEDILYGNNENLPALPTVEELVAIFAANSTFRVVDNGDGSFTATGNDDEVYMTSSTSFEINSAGAIMDDDGISYTLTSP